MSIRDGDTLVKDPDAVRVITFDWSEDLGEALISTSTWDVDGADAALTMDQESKTDTTASVRLTGGTLGKVYTLRNRVVTTATPSETEDATIRVRILTQ